VPSRGSLDGDRNSKTVSPVFILWVSCSSFSLDVLTGGGECRRALKANGSRGICWRANGCTEGWWKFPSQAGGSPGSGSVLLSARPGSPWGPLGVPGLEFRALNPHKCHPSPALGSCTRGRLQWHHSPHG
uniref:Uncharacterized protein n=1 Tax=Malurus cyaneus samueli TaxID=2593467 RepID=A0A8C5TLA5_9PASS